MIGEEHLWADDTCSTDKLVGRHCVGLVAWQEGDVDVVDVGHFGNVFRVAGNVDTQTVEREDVAVVASLRVKLLTAWRRVVCRHCFNVDVSAYLFLVAIFQG